MFPVQPSAKLDAIKIISYDSCVRSKGSVTPARLGSYHQHLQDPGIRMGLLFDLIAQLEIMHPDPSFFVHWQMFPIGVRTDDWQQRAAAANNDDDDDEDNWEPDFYSWTKSNYYPLFLDQQQQQELSNTITLYHNHDSWCGMGSLPSSGLIQDTSFLLTINEVPKSMLEYLEDPETYAVNWTDYGMSIKDGKFEVNKAELGATVSHAFALFEAVE